MKTPCVVATLALSFVGCARSPSDPPPGAATAQASAAVATAAPAASAGKPGQLVEIPQLGLKGRVPAGARKPTVAGEGMVLVEGGFTARVWATKPEDPKTLADARTFAANFKPKNLQAETLPDGWSVRFETGGPTYIVIVGRELGGKAVHCEATEDSPGEQDAALAFCKSLER
jgi:hypothetical protein